MAIAYTLEKMKLYKNSNEVKPVSLVNLGTVLDDVCSENRYNAIKSYILDRQRSQGNAVEIPKASSKPRTSTTEGPIHLEYDSKTGKPRNLLRTGNYHLEILRKNDDNGSEIFERCGPGAIIFAERPPTYPASVLTVIPDPGCPNAVVEFSSVGNTDEFCPEKNIELSSERNASEISPNASKFFTQLVAHIGGTDGNLNSFGRLLNSEGTRVLYIGITNPDQAIAFTYNDNKKYVDVAEIPFLHSVTVVKENNLWKAEGRPVRIDNEDFIRLWPFIERWN
jgi:hypothetical protein